MQHPKLYFYNHDGLLLKIKRDLVQNDNVMSSEIKSETGGIGWRRLTRNCLELVLPQLIVEGDFKVSQMMKGDWSNSYFIMLFEIIKLLIQGSDH